MLVSLKPTSLHAPSFTRPGPSSTPRTARRVRYLGSIQTTLVTATVDEDEHFMRMALEEAMKADLIGEVPIGAVLVCAGDVISKAYNRTAELQDPTAHAEMLCIQQAARTRQGWRLIGSTMYITTEPCPMCAGAILQARVEAVVYGAPQPRIGADGSWVNLLRAPVDKNLGILQPHGPHPFHPSLQVRSGVLSSQCRQVMVEFFKRRRKEAAAIRQRPQEPH